MKKMYHIMAIAVTVATAAIFTSCSQDDEPMMPTASTSDDMASRSEGRDLAYLVTFEEPASRILAGPSSYGENLYASYPGEKYVSYSYVFAPNDTITCGLNCLDGKYNFSNGGIALSQWNYRSNPSGKIGDWWYSYENQCSVYNTESVDGANKGAGAFGSNTFAVVYGYEDSYNEEYMSKPYFILSSPKNVSSMYICNSSYVYGVAKNGNTFGDEGEAVSLEKTKGWFKVIVTGYRQDGSTQTVEKYICDYRDSANPKIPLSTTWERWGLGLTNVDKVEFNFEGSDIGEYGLNTPAYICIDNISIN